MYWMNVDIPTRQCTLHRSGCTYERRKRATPYKGIGHLGRDGGWLSFSSEQEARDYFSRHFLPQGYQFVRCSYC